MAALADFLRQDHRRLDGILESFRQEADVPKRQSLFSTFASGLKMHIQWEEELLFPPFEDATGMHGAGPPAVMRMEHDQIKRLLDAITTAIGKTDVAASVDELIGILTEHNHKEEMILYPMLEQVLSAEQQNTAMEKIQKEAQR